MSSVASLDVEVVHNFQLLFGKLSGLLLTLIVEEANRNGRETANMQDFARSMKPFFDGLKETNDEALVFAQEARKNNASMDRSNPEP